LANELRAIASELETMGEEGRSLRVAHAYLTQFRQGRIASMVEDLAAEDPWEGRTALSLDVLPGLWKTDFLGAIKGVLISDGSWVEGVWDKIITPIQKSKLKEQFNEKATTKLKEFCERQEGCEVKTMGDYFRSPENTKTKDQLLRKVMKDLRYEGQVTKDEFKKLFWEAIKKAFFSPPKVVKFIKTLWAAIKKAAGGSPLEAIAAILSSAIADIVFPLLDTVCVPCGLAVEVMGPEKIARGILDVLLPSMKKSTELSDWYKEYKKEGEPAPEAA